jgi:LPXTG-motif cell wall-anchored protein
MVLHAGGNMLNVLTVLGQDRSEWQLAGRPSLIWETGTDDAFWISLLGFLTLLTISIFAFRQVSKSVDKK